GAHSWLGPLLEQRDHGPCPPGAVVGPGFQGATPQLETLAHSGQTASATNGARFVEGRARPAMGGGVGSGRRLPGVLDSDGHGGLPRRPLPRPDGEMYGAGRTVTMGVGQQLADDAHEVLALQWRQLR